MVKDSEFSDVCVGARERRFLSKIRVLRLCARLDEVLKRVLFAGDQFRVSSAFISLGDFLINVWFDIIMRSISSSTEFVFRVDVSLNSRHLATKVNVHDPEVNVDCTFALGLKTV